MFATMGAFAPIQQNQGMNNGVNNDMNTTGIEVGRNMPIPRMQTQMANLLPSPSPSVSDGSTDDSSVSASEQEQEAQSPISPVSMPGRSFDFGYEEGRRTPTHDTTTSQEITSTPESLLENENRGCDDEEEEEEEEQKKRGGKRRRDSMSGQEEETDSESRQTKKARSNRVEPERATSPHAIESALRGAAMETTLTPPAETESIGTDTEEQAPIVNEQQLASEDPAPIGPDGERPGEEAGSPQPRAAKRSAEGMLGEEEKVETDAKPPKRIRFTFKNSAAGCLPSQEEPKSKKVKGSPKARTRRGKSKALEINRDTLEESPVASGAPDLGEEASVAPQTPAPPPIAVGSQCLTPATPESVGDSESNTVVGVDPTFGGHFVPRERPVGLKNLGHTCYFTSVVQALSSSPEFLKALWSRKLVGTKEGLIESHKRKLGGGTATGPARRTRRGAQPEPQNSAPNDADLYKELAELLHCIVYQDKDTLGQKKAAIVNPQELVNLTQLFTSAFAVNEQHDAQEYLRVLLNMADERESVLGAEAEAPQPGTASSLFRGQYQSTSKCQECPNSSSKTEEFMDLSLDMPQEDPATAAPSKATRGRGKKAAPRSVPLKDCIDLYTRPEILEYSPRPSGDGCSQGRPSCPRCEGSETFARSLHIEECPPALTLHIKRHRYAYGGFEKVDTHVEFPLDNFDLAPWMVAGEVSGSTRYRLLSVIVHSGDVHGGHYYAYKRVEETGEWWKVNDAKAQKVTEEEVAAATAYLLLYARIDNGQA